MEPTEPAKPIEKEPPWLTVALGHLGCHERGGDGRLNPVVRGFFSATKFPMPLVSAKTAWCAAFVCTCLETGGYRSTRSAAAKSYLLWGRELVKLQRGAVLVFRRGHADAATGHVGFYVGESDDRESLLVLGGNQKNCVGVERYERDRLLAVRWPVVRR